MEVNKSEGFRSWLFANCCLNACISAQFEPGLVDMKGLHSLASTIGIDGFFHMSSSH